MGLIDKIGGKGLVAGAMLGAGVLCSGCNAHLSPYGRSFGRSLVESGAREAVVGGVRNEVEGPRGTTVNVGEGRYKSSLVLYLWKDFNENGKIEDRELVGETNYSININAFNLVAFGKNRMPMESCVVLDSNDEVVVREDNSRGALALYDDMPSGEYTIFAKLRNGDNVSKKFRVTR